jgi:phosphatidylinositol alpha-1,6-mannosyltransferase
MQKAEFIILTHEYPPRRGGAGVYCREMAIAAQKNSVKVSVWAPSGSTKDDQIEMIALPWTGSQSFISSWKLVRKIKKFITTKEDHRTVFHLAEPGSTRAFIRFGWIIRSNIKFILTIHGSELLRFTRNPFEKWLFKKLLGRCSRIHVLSRYNESQLIGLYPFTKTFVKRIPGAAATGVNPEKQNPEKQTNSESIQIVCVGRIHPRKGQDQLILALLKLPVEIQKTLYLCFVGPINNPKYSMTIQNLVKEFAGEVTFEGDCADQELASIYAKSDIFALTSLPTTKSVEGFGFVYLEASAHGLPIIANKTGGVEDAVIDNETGLLSEPNDLETLSKNFLTLISDKNYRKKIGQNGIEWASSHNWLNTAKKLYSDI